MKYIAYKEKNDRRIMTRGMLFPDGFYRVFELTQWNGTAVESLMDRGYVVQEVDEAMPCGLYESQSNQRVTDASVWKMIGDVQGAKALEFVPEDAEYDDPVKYIGMPKHMAHRAYAPTPAPVVPRPAVARDELKGQQRKMRISQRT